MGDKPYKQQFVNRLPCVYAVSVLSAFNSEIVTFPLDLMKTRLQIQGERMSQLGQAPSRGMTKTAIEIVTKDGFFKLWEGISAMFLKHTFYSGFRIISYKGARNFFTSRSETEKFGILESIACGVYAGVIATLVANPADIVKVQMQMEGKRRLMGLPPRNTGLIDAFVKIWNLGGVRALWRGTVPHTVRTTTVTIGMVSGYDSSKRLLQKYLNLPDNWINHCISSFNAGFLAAVLCLPADVIKSRIMNQPLDKDGQGLLYKGSLHCLQKTLQDEGFFALYKGFLPLWVRLGPWAMIFWMSYENIMRSIGGSSF